MMNDNSELSPGSICYGAMSPNVPRRSIVALSVQNADGCAVTTDSGTEPVHHHQTAPDNNAGRPVG